jgi:hypothetical protein
MNKKYSMNMLVELDLQKKYEKLLKDKEIGESIKRISTSGISMLYLFWPLLGGGILIRR